MERKFEIDLFDSRLAGKRFEFDIDDAVFAEIDGLIQRGHVHSTIECLTAGQTFRFRIHSSGTVVVPCDRCLADLDLRVETTDDLQVALGDSYDDDGEVLTVPEKEGLLDVSLPIYEFIVLSMPISHVHEPGMCDEAIMEEISKHQAARSSREDADDDSAPTDSRWDALRDLKQ